MTCSFGGAVDTHFYPELYALFASNYRWTLIASLYMPSARLKGVSGVSPTEARRMPATGVSDGRSSHHNLSIREFLYNAK